MVPFYFEAENSYGALLEQEAAVKFKVKSDARAKKNSKSLSQKKKIGVIVGICITLSILGLIIGLNINEDNDITSSDYDSSYDTKSNYDDDNSYYSDDNYDISESTAMNKTYEHPEIWMRESDMKNTEIGEPDSVEKSFDYDAYDKEHKYKTYHWDENNFDAVIEYHRHFSTDVDDYINYPLSNGYVSRVSYIDDNGVAHSIDEVDYIEKDIWDLQ